MVDGWQCLPAILWGVYGGWMTVFACNIVMSVWGMDDSVASNIVGSVWWMDASVCLQYCSECVVDG